MGVVEKNLRRGGTIPTKPYIPRVWLGEQKWETKAVFGSKEPTR